MADYLDSVKQGNEQSRAALLEAIRTQGSQAKAAFDQAQQAIAAQKQQALQAALAQATQRGAPREATEQNAQTISAPYDRRVADLQSSAASRLSSIEGAGASAGRYFDQVNASLPAIRARLDESRGAQENQLAQRLAELRAQQREQEEARMERAERRAAAERSEQRDIAERAAKPVNVGSVLGETFGGLGSFKDVVHQQVPQVVQSTAAGDFMNPAGPFWSRLSVQPGGVDEQLHRAVAEDLGQQAGLPYGRGGMIGYEPPAGPKPGAIRPDVLPGYTAGQAMGWDTKRVDDVVRMKSKVAEGADKGKQDSPFQDAIDTYNGVRDDRGTLEEADAAVSEGLIAKYGHDYPNLRQLVAAMYRS